MVERKRFTPTYVSVKRTEFYSTIRDLVIANLKVQDIEPTERNMRAFKRRAKEHYGIIQRKDFSLTFDSEWHLILDEAAKLTLARIIAEKEGPLSLTRGKKKG